MKSLNELLHAEDGPGLGRFAMPIGRPVLRPKSHRVGMAVATLALAGILPLLIVSTVLVTVLSRDQRRSADRMAQTQADAMLGEVDEAIATELKLLQWVASSPSIGTGRLDDFQAEAQRAVMVAKDWTSVALIEGRTGGILVDTWPGKPSFLPQISTGIDLGAILKARGPYVSGYVEAGAVSSQAGILLIAPTLQDDSTILVAALIDAPALESLLRTVLETGNPPPQARLQLVDRTGTLLADTEGSPAVGQAIGSAGRRAILSGRSGGFTDGEGRRGTYGTSPISGWSVLLSLPASAVEGDFSRPVLVAAIGGFGAVLLAGLLAIIVIRDLGLRRKTEEALQQAQKMELIGQMTGGVAHDFNNLLTVIGGNLDLLASEVDTNPRALRMVRSAARAAERGGRLTAQLLAYSRRQRLHPVPVDVNQLIGEIAELVDRIRGEAVPLVPMLGEGLWIVQVDTLQLQSSILNLVLNAREAMPRGGTLTIRTRNVEPAEPAASGFPGGAIELAVADTGAGMTPQVAARAFDPFFTTKEVGNGSGLGLSQVFGFVQQSGGRVTIDSKEGQGTTVRILLPRLADGARPS
jgi:signal transduction histidine kinase